MIIKMKPKQHYQDSKIHLAPDMEYEVDTVLGNWLIDNNKAVPVVKQLESEPQFEQAEEPPHFVHRDEQSQPFRKPRGGRGGAK